MKLKDPDALETAVASIARRRAACGDDCEMLPGDPWGVLGYVLSHRDVPDCVLAGDAGDALVLAVGLQAELARREKAALRLARDKGVTWSQIALYLNLGSAQAAQQRAQRLGAVEAGPPRNTQLVAGGLEASAGMLMDTACAVADASLPPGDVQEYAGYLREALSDEPVALKAVIANLALVVNELVRVGELRYLGRKVRDDALWLVLSWERMQPDAVAG